MWHWNQSLSAYKIHAAHCLVSKLEVQKGSTHLPHPQHSPLEHLLCDAPGCPSALQRVREQVITGYKNFKQADRAGKHAHRLKAHTHTPEGGTPTRHMPVRPGQSCTLVWVPAGAVQSLHFCERLCVAKQPAMNRYVSCCACVCNL